MSVQEIHLRLGDCRDRIAEVGAVGAVVCDPPYGLEFMGKDWDKLTGPTKTWEAGGGFSKPGIGDRKIAWPSYSAAARHGAANPTCAECGGRLRGKKKCHCPKPHDHWKPIGKRRKLPQDTPDHITSTGMKEHLQAMQTWHKTWLAEAFAALEPGGIIKVFGGTRVYHRLAAAMSEAGFTKIQLEAWTYGSGFPKSLNVGKAINKQAGVDPSQHAAVQAYLREAREAKGLSKTEVDKAVFGGTTRYSWVEGRGGKRSNEVYLPTPEEWAKLKDVLGLGDRFDAYIAKAIPSREHRLRADGGKAALVCTEDGDWGYQKDGERWDGTRRITAPTTEDAETWEGWGTALKPAWEPVLVGRKP